MRASGSARPSDPVAGEAMDHRAFLAALPPEERAALHVRSDRAGLAHLAVHAGAILGCGAWIALGLPLWWALIPVQGVLIAFLFTLQHECTHRTPFASRGVNEWVGRVAGFLIAQPFAWFRAFHLAHHRHTNDPARDPELQGGGKPEGWRAMALHLSGWPYWRAHALTLVRAAFGRVDGDYVGDRARPRIVREARIMLAGYALVALSLTVTPVLFWVWLLPVALGMPALRFYVLAEHARCPAAADMFANTRTTLTSRLVRRLAWNMPFHAEHHAAPDVPFHALPRLHAAARPHLKVVEPGYRAFARRYAGWLSRSAARGAGSTSPAASRTP